eukprot:scaffold301_cov243-Pinguiococcus_pyrenoidosus.AAC.50
MRLAFGEQQETEGRKNRKQAYSEAAGVSGSASPPDAAQNRACSQSSQLVATRARGELQLLRTVLAHVDFDLLVDILAELLRGERPRGGEVELAELLRELERLVDHSLLLVVVAHFRVPAEREILSQRVPLEPVVGQDAPKVRVVQEEDAEHVVDFALPPVGIVVHAASAVNRRHFVRVRLDAQPTVEV